MRQQTMVRASTKLEFAWGLATAMADAIGDKVGTDAWRAVELRRAFPFRRPGSRRWSRRMRYSSSERTTLCPDHAGSTTTAKPNFDGQIAVTSRGGWPGSPDRDGVWVGRRRRKGQQAVSLTRSCAECARCSRSRSMLALRAWRWRFDRSALRQALFDFAVKLRAHSAQLRVKQALHWHPGEGTRGTIMAKTRGTGF